MEVLPAAVMSDLSSGVSAAPYKQPSRGRRLLYDGCSYQSCSLLHLLHLLITSSRNRDHFDKNLPSLLFLVVLTLTCSAATLTTIRERIMFMAFIWSTILEMKPDFDLEKQTLPFCIECC